ncbi:hypothetical protein Acsp06_43660 [Actinomycetospora sp. NBRC 106375]|uniref:BTAD domain-containing putative transcriptional regulator n=1 Tax=Actinomycetospora sp. NBRC 106375 TaxID=3032207 RepID=UPI0024A5E14C|nr:BTAD domain-containing putative transcriptional regulator [Actinomycetospora sp. NBRC 106375]GLZ48181.1 hypothetical protein Acsp06_43660 [Actinomycetospora sp. NBRC 106375]
MIEFRVLGQLEVVREGESLNLRGPKQRSVLAMLLLNAGRVVAVHELVDGIWGERPPDTAENTVQVYVSTLARTLEPDRPARDRELIRTRGGGYVLELGAHPLDLQMFLTEVADAHALLQRHRHAEASALFERALSRWRGPALGDLGDQPFAATEIPAIEESRLAAIEASLEAEMALGRHGSAIPRLTRLVDQHPLRERFHAQLMTALYAAERQADALEVYRRARAVLHDELGVDPGERLNHLHQAILHGDVIDAVVLPAKDGATVDFRDSDGQTRQMTLDPARTVTIGRRSTNDICLAGDSQVSRSHARLEPGVDGWGLVDDGPSHNGTFVNGDRVEGSCRLHDGSVIRVGRTVLIFREAAPELSVVVGESSPTSAASLPRHADVDEPSRDLLRALRDELSSDVTRATSHQLSQRLAARTGLTLEAVSSTLARLRRQFDVADTPTPDQDHLLLDRARALGLLRLET